MDGGGTGPAACGLSHSAFNSSSKVNAQSTYGWTCTATERNLTGTRIPDHAVTTGTFATTISPQNISLSFPL